MCKAGFFSISIEATKLRWQVCPYPEEWCWTTSIGLAKSWLKAGSATSSRFSEGLGMRISWKSGGCWALRHGPCPPVGERMPLSPRQAQWRGSVRPSEAVVQEWSLGREFTGESHIWQVMPRVGRIWGLASAYKLLRSEALWTCF